MASSGFLDLGCITYDILWHMKFYCIKELWNYPWSPSLNEDYTNYLFYFILLIDFSTNSFQVQYLGSLFYLVEFLSLNSLSCAKHALIAFLFSRISTLTLSIYKTSTHQHSAVKNSITAVQLVWQKTGHPADLSRSQIKLQIALQV